MWRDRIYRENWITGINIFAEPFRLTYTIRFDDGHVVEQTQILQPYERLAIRVDDLYPAQPDGRNINAAFIVTAPKALPLNVAVWHAPIGKGVTPVVYAVQWTCRDKTSNP